MSDESTPDEQREASALAEALDACGTGNRGDAPAELVEAANLVRLGALGAWDASRREEHGQRVLHEAEGRLQGWRARRRERSRQRRLGFALAACLAGALVAVARPWQGDRPATAAVAALPPPGTELLASHLAAAGGDEVARAQLRDEMRGYRSALYAHIRTHYEETR